MSLSGHLQHNTHIELSKSSMSNKLFFSQNPVLCLITTKSTTLKFKNHFSFPFSLKCSITTSQSESTTQPFAVSYLINNFGFSSESALKAFNLKQEVKGLGFDPSTTAFGTALVTKQWMSNILWDKKVDVFIKWGWSDEDVIRVFRSQPSLMLTSIDKINLLMSFWVNQMGWDPLALTNSPLMFSFSLPKRIIPRASVLQFLLMKGLRKKKASLVRPFAYSEDMFLNKCVFSFKEESDYLLKLYDEKMKLANTTENNGMPSTKCIRF